MEITCIHVKLELDTVSTVLESYLSPVNKFLELPLFIYLYIYNYILFHKKVISLKNYIQHYNSIKALAEKNWT